MARMEIKSIQYLRGAAALAVVLFHYLWILNTSNQFNIPHLGSILFSGGRGGVDLFFIISGFVMVLSTERNLGLRNNAIGFLLKRFFRIYPILIFFVAIISITKEADLYTFLRSIIPLHKNYDSAAPFFGYNVLAVAWTLTYELFFYLVFFISMIMSHKYRGLICVCAIITLMFLTQYYFTGAISIDSAYKVESNSSGIAKVFFSLSSSPMLLEFCMGVAAFYLYKYINIKNPIYIMRPLLICTIASLSIILISYNTFYEHGISQWGIISFGIICAFLIYEKTFGIGCSSILGFLGDISYSVYMSHIIIMPYIRTFGSNIHLSGFPLIALGVLITLMVSTLTYSIIEKPAASLCKNLLKKMK